MHPDTPSSWSLTHKLVQNLPASESNYEPKDGGALIWWAAKCSRPSCQSCLKDSSNQRLQPETTKTWNMVWPDAPSSCLFSCHGAAADKRPKWSQSWPKARRSWLRIATPFTGIHCHSSLFHKFCMAKLQSVSLERSCNSIFPGHICVMFCHGFPHIYPACHLRPKALPAHGSQSETASRNRCSQKMSQDVRRCQKSMYELMNVCQTWPCHAMPKESNNALEVFAVFFAAFAFAAKTAFVAIIMFDCDRWWAWCVSLSLAGADQSLLEPWRWAIRGLWYRCCIGFWSWYCM